MGGKFKKRSSKFFKKRPVFADSAAAPPPLLVDDAWAEAAPPSNKANAPVDEPQHAAPPPPPPPTAEALAAIQAAQTERTDKQYEGVFCLPTTPSALPMPELGALQMSCGMSLAFPRSVRASWR